MVISFSNFLRKRRTLCAYYNRWDASALLKNIFYYIILFHIFGSLQIRFGREIWLSRGIQAIWEARKVEWLEVYTLGPH
jgi:hypothetical protein